MDYRFVTADVFTDRLFGGNPLAVFPEARGISDADMQLIARELNLSETVFVLPPDNPANTRRLRIFTPSAELPFAGHPTVGTAHVLAALGAFDVTRDVAQVVFEEGVGPVPVLVRSEHGEPVFCQLAVAKLPELESAPPSVADIASVISLDREDVIAGDDGPAVISCGVPFLLVPLRERAALGRARPDPARWRTVLADPWPKELFAFHWERSGNGLVHARMFAPALGIGEDPATGAAVCALGGYLGPRDPALTGRLEWTVEQGRDMGRPSRLELEVDKHAGEITAVRVGGRSVLFSSGVVELGERNRP
jgi:trans-2,3-dihydro-3-hydroxyanthranilate isomerase